MSRGDAIRSFADPDTEFAIVRSDTPKDEPPRGYKLGEPTGEVRCVECGRVARVVEEIPHEVDCPQRFVASQWWGDQLLR